MTHIYGTSHVSGESMELIDEKLEQHDPDIVAVELDLVRLNALLNEKEEVSGPFFIKLVKKFQDYVGSKTGVMPGEEMLYAYRKAISEGREVAFIDQDIRVTVDRLQTVSRKEKFRAVVEIIAGMLLPGRFDASEIPDEDVIKQLLEELEQKFPGLYRVLVEERNRVMADHLRGLEQEAQDAEIVAFVGAAHRKDLEQLLETN